MEPLTAYSHVKIYLLAWAAYLENKSEKLDSFRNVTKAWYSVPSVFLLEKEFTSLLLLGCFLERLEGHVFRLEIPPSEPSGNCHSRWPCKPAAPLSTCRAGYLRDTEAQVNFLYWKCELHFLKVTQFIFHFKWN